MVPPTNVTEPTKTIVTTYNNQIDNKTKNVTSVSQTSITSTCENGFNLCDNNNVTFCSNTACPSGSVSNSSTATITTNTTSSPQVIKNVNSTITMVATQLNPTTTLVTIYTTPTIPQGATNTVTPTTIVTQLYVVDLGCGSGFTLKTVNNIATCSR